MRKIVFLFVPDCEQAKELQWHEFEGPLTGKYQRGLRRHLKVCRHCSKYREQLHSVRDELKQSGGTALNRNYKMSAETFERLQAVVASNRKE